MRSFSQKLLSLSLALLMLFSVMMSGAGAGLTASAKGGNNGNANPNRVEAIEITAKPDKTEYIIGEKLDLTGAKVKITYGDGSVKEIEAEDFAEYKIITDPENGSELVSDGNIKVKFTAGEKTADITIVVSPAQETEIKAEAIEITAQPDKTEYIVGEKLDLTGAKVKITYGDGSVKEIEAEDFAEYKIITDPENGSELVSDGNIKVKFTAGEKTADITIVVSPAQETEIKAEAIEITAQPDKTEYIVGEKLDLTGLTVKVTYDGGSIEEFGIEKFEEKGVSASPANGTEMTESGRITVTFTVGEKSASTTVNVVSKETERDTVRISGDDRYQTAAAISSAGWEKADTVIIANGADFADALAGAPLSYAVNAPILLTAGDLAEQDIIEEIKRLGAKNAYILGGENAVSADAQKALEGMEINVMRLGGKTRLETSVSIAEQLAKISGKAEQAFIVNGFNYPDALSVSPVAALLGSPIFYVDTQGNVDENTAQFIKNNEIGKIRAVGGEEAVPAEAMEQLEKLGVGTDRIGGEDRYETSLMIAESFGFLFTGEGITAATGLNFPDALSGSAFAAKNKMPILLTGEKLSDDIQTFVKSSDPSVVYVFGGKNAVSDDIVNAIKTA